VSGATRTLNPVHDGAEAVRFAVSRRGHHQGVSANAEPPNSSVQATAGLAELSEQIASARAQSTSARPSANGAGPQAPGAGEETIPPLAVSSRRPWWDRIEGALSRLGTALSRPPVRLAVAGILVLLVAIMIVPSSVWTLPLVIVGALMVLVAWVGSRLRGHVLVEWGETGARLDFHAEVASPRHRHAPPARLPVIAAVPERDDPGLIGVRRRQ
jgi:hypothetical protein